MEYIKSKDLCMLIQDTLALIDQKIIEHGRRTAYIFSTMLACQGNYEKYEIADLTILALLHDIGVYKTGGIREMMRVEIKNPMPHSIYGYLFFKYLSPHPEYARILLYHHLDYVQTLDIEDPYIELARHLNLAEKADIYHSALREDFDHRMLEKDAGTRYAWDSFDLLGQAVVQYDILSKLTDGSYVSDLNDTLNYTLLSDQEKNWYLKMLMHCIGFRSEHAVIDSVTCICICDEFGKLWKLSSDERELLYYSALLHDIGMLTVPKNILESRDSLDEEQLAVLRGHVHCAREVLRGKIHQDVVDIVYAHHERLDGSGYPVGKKTGPMSDLQKILQMADTITTLAHERTDHSEKTPEGIKDKVIGTLEEEVKAGRFDRIMVDRFIRSYDPIMNEVRKRSKNILKMHSRLNTQYRQVYHSLKA